MAQGAGTIPYGSDFEFDEETCSSFRDTDSQQNQFDLNESMNSMDKFMSQRSMDSTDHNKSIKQPAKRKNPGSNKINKQLQAKAEAAAASNATATTTIDISKPINLQQFQQQAGNNQQLIFRLNEDGTVSSQSNNQQFIFNGSGGTAIQLTPSHMTNVADSSGKQPFQLVSAGNVHGTVAQMTQAVTVLQAPIQGQQEPQAAGSKKPEPKKRRKKNEHGDESGGGGGGGEKTVQKLINANNEQMNINK